MNKLHPIGIWNLLKEWYYYLRAANSTPSTESEGLFACRNEPLTRQNNTRSHLVTALSQLLYEFSFSDGILVCNSRNRGANVQKTSPVTENSSHTGCCRFPSLTCVSHFTGQYLILFALKFLDEFLLNPWMASCSAESKTGHGSTLGPAASSTPFSICSSDGRQHRGRGSTGSQLSHVFPSNIFSTMNNFNTDKQSPQIWMYLRRRENLYYGK